MASTSYSPRGEHTHFDMSSDLETVLEGQPVSSLATWVLGHLRYPCVVLGRLASCCLPSFSSMEQPLVEAKKDSDVVIVGNRSEKLGHKVFFSHSGAQKDFVEQLCVDLQRSDRDPFFDKLRSSIPIGTVFPAEIFEAIAHCRVGVVVLSEEFFMSKWPMLELHAMVNEVKRRQRRWSMTIVPVFYFISIDALRDAKNRRRWISKWEQWAANDDRIDVEKWKRTLEDLVSINSIARRREAVGDVKMRAEIVAEVCKWVPPDTQWDDSHVQGRSRNCKVIWDKIQQLPFGASARIHVVGLYGVGGIGKTTISKALCNELSPKFNDDVCHMELGSASEMELLKRALKRLTDMGHDVVNNLEDVDQGYAYLKKRMHSRPVFLVLDNVQDEYKSTTMAKVYLNAGFGTGSVVLVTARSLDALKKLKLDESQCLEMPELEQEEARALFLSWAEVPSGDGVDEALIRDCMRQCHFGKGDGRSKHYHPLALKVLGQELSGRSSTQWASQVQKIKTYKQQGYMQHPVFSIFRNNFESLSDELQLLFMDLALMVTSEYDFPEVGSCRRDWLCMVHQQTVDDMKDMLETLKRKSLLEDLSDDFTKIGMHDLWVEFAMAMSKGEEPRWVYEVDGRRAVGVKRGRAEGVERMCFVNEGWKGLDGLNLRQFACVEAFKLRVGIDMENCALDVDLSGLKRLRSFLVSTPGLKVRAHGLTSLTNLVFVDWWTPGFSPCLDGIGRLKHLQFLALEDITGVEVLDITELRVLQALLLEAFPDLVTVKGLPSSVTIVVFGKCTLLRECWGLDTACGLETLNLSHCDSLEELPGLGKLTSLKALEILKCESLEEVIGLGDLVGLKKLIVSGCIVLPDLERLTKLRVLDTMQCRAPGLQGLVSLRTLCGSFQGQQPVFPKASLLMVVKVVGWDGLLWSSLRSLIMLEELELRFCKGEDVVPDLQDLKRLKSMTMHKCQVKDLSGLSSCPSLEALTVIDCGNLERLPDLDNLTRLRITGCQRITHWPSSSHSLISIIVDRFSLEKMIPTLESLTNLRDLGLCGDGCEAALSIASFSSSLEELCVANSATTEVLDVSAFSQLRVLYLRCCGALRKLTCGAAVLAAMSHLELKDCESLVEVPDLSVFPHLESLELKYCTALTRVACTRLLIGLDWINVSGCKGGLLTPILSMFPNLTHFRVKKEL